MPLHFEGKYYEPKCNTYVYVVTYEYKAIFPLHSQWKQRTEIVKLGLNGSYTSARLHYSKTTNYFLQSFVPAMRRIDDMIYVSGS